MIPFTPPVSKGLFKFILPYMDNNNTSTFRSITLHLKHFDKWHCIASDTPFISHISHVTKAFSINILQLIGPCHTLGGYSMVLHRGKTGYDPRPDHVGFPVDKVAVGWVL